MSSRNFIPFVQLKLRWNFGGQIKSTTHRWLWPRVWASEFDNPCQCLHLDFVMIFYGISVSKLVIQWFYALYHDSCLKITFWIFLKIFHVFFMPKHTALKLHTTTSAALYAQKFSLNFQFEMIVFKKWTDHVTHLFLDDHLFYMHSVHFDWIFFHIWCSLGHGRKFIKDAPSACRINGHINHFDMKLVMFLINVEKKPKLLFWCIFFLKFLFKKIKAALRIAFSWIVKKKKKKKKKKTHSALQFSDLLQETDLFFFGLRTILNALKPYISDQCIAICLLFH